MNANEMIDRIISKLPDWRGTTLTKIRRIIHEADPDVIEEVKWMGTPTWSHDGIICVAKALKDKVKVTFYKGANLPDPEHVFNNGLGGKQWHAIDLYESDKINEESLKALVHSAVVYNQTKVKPTKKISANLSKKPVR